MTYQTNNPVGSVDVRDLYDNADAFDKFSAGPLDAYPDRFGVSRQSLQGIRNASQYQVLGPYAAGLQFTALNQLFSYLGEFYAPGPAITLPYTTTGVGAAEIATFRSVGDALLRQDLAAPTGATLVGSGSYTVAGELAGVAVNIVAEGADKTGVADSTAAINAAIQAARVIGGDGYTTPLSGRVIFPNGKYKISDELLAYNGIYLDGESAGGVIIEQTDPTKNAIVYVDEVTGIDTPLTLKRLVVSYPTPSVTPGVTGIKVHSSTAASPVLEDVLTYQAYDGFSFLLTINAVMTRCYAVDCANDGFAFPETGGGLLNSVAAISGCYAAGCGGAGWSGSLIGSSMQAVASDRCGVGFNMRLINTDLVGSTEAFVSFGVQLTDSKASRVKMYAVGDVGASAAFFLVDSQDIVLDTPVSEWAGGFNSHTVTTSGTTARITVINSGLTSNGLGIYSDKAVITEIGQGMRVGETPDNTAQPFECGFSGGTGEQGSTNTSGFRVGTASGFGCSMEAWDEGSPRFGLYQWYADTPSCVFEGSSLATDLVFRHKPVLVSSGGVKWRLVVSDAGALTTALVP